MKKLILIFQALVLLSCNSSNELASEIKEYGFQTESYILKGFSKNGKLDGPVTVYYLDGSLKILWMAKNGKTDGKTMEYYPNGRLKIFQTYIDGKRNGYRYSFSETGHLTYKELFLNGEMVGHDYIYDSKGRPYIYRFYGYSNKHYFKQEIDTVTGQQKFYGSIIIDDLFLVDTLNNETKVMVAKPIGIKMPDVTFILTCNVDSSIGLELDRISEFDEHVYKLNILNVGSKYRPGIAAFWDSCGRIAKDGFFMDHKRYMLIENYTPDSNTTEVNIESFRK